MLFENGLAGLHTSFPIRATFASRARSVMQANPSTGFFLLPRFFMTEQNGSSSAERDSVQGQRFTSAQLVVDGKHFEDCDFDTCTFVYRGGIPPNFIRCEFASPHFVFKDAAQRTMQFMSAIYNGIDPRVIEMTFDEIRKEPGSM